MKYRLRIACSFWILCFLELLSGLSAAATVGAYYYPWWGQGGGGHTFSQTLRSRLPVARPTPVDR